MGDRGRGGWGGGGGGGGGGSMLYALIPPEGMNSMPLLHLSSPEEKNIYVSDTCLIKPVCNVKMYIVSIYMLYKF